MGTFFLTEKKIERLGQRREKKKYCHLAKILIFKNS